MTGIKAGSILLLNRPGEKPERVRLGDELNSGGAGIIYTIADDSARVIKIYHPETLLSEGVTYQGKIECMLSNAPNMPEISTKSGSIVQLAWPIASAHTLKNKFVGFAMPVIDLKRTAELELILSPKQANQYGLRYDLGVAISLAANVASVVSSIHARGHAIVDLKPVNLKYYVQELMVAVLDCDGFYIKLPGSKSEAPQVTPDYLAPEFQNDLVVTNPEHQDRFALAVIIFKLLNYDIHPYAAVPKNGKQIPSDLEEKIRAGLYPYGVVPHSLVSPVHASVHETFPHELRVLFDRSFGNSHSLRPSVIEWVDALKKYAKKSEENLVQCAHDSSHLQFKDMPCAACKREQLIGQASRKQQRSKFATKRSGVGVHLGNVRQTSNMQHTASISSTQPSANQSLSHQSSPQISVQNVAPSKSKFTAVLLIWLTCSIIAGFYIGKIFWYSSLGFASALYILAGRRMGAGAERIGGALVGGIAFSGLIFGLLWIGGLFLSNGKPSKDNIANESLEHAAVILPSKREVFFNALHRGDLDGANKSFPLAVAEYLESKEANKESYGKLLAETLNLIKRDISENRKDDAQRVLFGIDEELLKPQVLIVQSSSASKQAEVQITSLLADLYWSQKNYAQAISAAIRVTSSKIVTADDETNSAINNAHFVLSNALLMTGKSKEAAKEYEEISVDLLTGTDAISARLMKLVAGTQSNQITDPEAEARKQLVSYKEEDINAALNSIRGFSDGSPVANEVQKVAERLSSNAINFNHFVLANSLLMSGQSKMAVNEYQSVSVDLLPASDRLLAQMMRLIAGTQAKLILDPEDEVRKQLATYKDEEMHVVLKSIKGMVGGRPEAQDVSKVAERLVEVKIRGPSIFDQASSVLGRLFKSNNNDVDNGKKDSQ